MTDFVITITNPDQLAGISWAREQFNASLPPPPVMFDAEGNPIEPQPAAAQEPLETDDDYIQWVMEQAAVSYAQQKMDAEWRDAYETAKTAARKG